jgi:hypothetical protein
MVAAAADGEIIRDGRWRASRDECLLGTGEPRCVSGCRRETVEAAAESCEGGGFDVSDRYEQRRRVPGGGRTRGAGCCPIRRRHLHRYAGSVDVKRIRDVARDSSKDGSE